MRRIQVLFFLFFTIEYVSAQKQGNIWYFGPNGAGLDFNYCPPQVLTNGWNNTSTGLFEGSTTISDSNGQLLFYSNGTSVLNANHVFMQNGSAVLGGNTNTMTQNIIIPKPGSSSIYYLFSPQVQAFQGPGGVLYCVIDMSLAGGLGAVTSYGNILRDTVGRRCSEKLTAVKHTNGLDTWLIGHDYFSNNFFSYLITSTGINSVPVETSVGLVMTDPINQSHYDAIGELKASPDRNKLGFTTHYTSVAAVFDFNNSTGIVSNPVELKVTNGGSWTQSYGVSFSHDNSKFYVAATTYISNNFLYHIDQFDLTGTWDSLTINSSRTIITVPSRPYSLKLGPDKKIYVAKSTGTNHLGIINYPDLGGVACNYVDQGVYLNGLDATWGLNNLMEMFDTCSQVMIESVNSNRISFYPNPTNEKFFVESPTCEKLQLQIFDPEGRVCLTQTVIGKTAIDASVLAEGVYTLSIRGIEGIITRKLVIVK